MSNLAKLIEITYKLRQEGVKVVHSENGRFPVIVVLNPSERLIKNSVEVKIKKNGSVKTLNVANENGVNIYF
ncbi:hypothetical protein CEP49_06615 [Mergibacter septicus]|uniref:hypothetical protein n=1 Tax=Mergibacter septicus TaxID=221402 RepID=UPI0011791C1A|nr:hypothetical protein [Mergibacter septicus]AWX14243.1 hypothetical protein CEP49_06615 [Mergibacter septicus]